MPIKKGDTVKVHYTGSLADGTIFDTSRDRDPLEFVTGKQMLVPGFEAAVMGREEGESISVTFPASEGYGSSDSELIFTVPISEVPEHITPEVGMQLQLSSDQGDMDVTISGITEDEIELDANHPLAGKDLTFDIEIVSVSN